MTREEILFRILKYLPRKVAVAVSDHAMAMRERAVWISEIRLRADLPLSLTCGDRNVCKFHGEVIVCNENEVAETLQRLCEDSVHSYSETIKEGFLSLENGVRVGVCGMVSMEGSTIKSVYRVLSLAIRIPHHITGAAKPILPLLCGEVMESALIYAPPNVGKTTLIRDLARSVSCGNDARRVALIDTRGEIFVREWFDRSLIDVLRGYPRAKGIEIATRTLSPEIIFCDEIGSGEEAAAILSAQNSGVPLIATAHASSLSMLLRRPNIKMLGDHHVFRYYIGISREPMKTDFRFDIYDTERERILCGS